jgi:hypothetical protein
LAIVRVDEVTIDRPDPLLTERLIEAAAGLLALGVSFALILAGTGLLVWAPALASQGQGLAPGGVDEPHRQEGE